MNTTTLHINATLLFINNPQKAELLPFLNYKQSVNFGSSGELTIIDRGYLLKQIKSDRTISKAILSILFNMTEMIIIK